MSREPGIVDVLNFLLEVVVWLLGVAPWLIAVPGVIFMIWLLTREPGR